jgi:hypothetical protein
MGYFLETFAGVIAVAAGFWLFWLYAKACDKL